MQDHVSKRSRVNRLPASNRRQFMAGAAAAAGAYGLPFHAWAQGVPNEFDGSKFQLKAARAQCQVGRRAAIRHHRRGRRISTSTSRARSTAWAARAACSTTWCGAIRATAARRSFPIWRTAGRSPRTARPTRSMLRKGVQFHDGAELTSEDVKATFDRIAKPPQGISDPAQHAVRRGRGDQRARQVHRGSSSSAAAAAPTSSWRRSPAAGTASSARRRWRTTSYNLRRVVDIPGTGPFKSKRRVENEVWVMEKNKNYWNKGLPYLDGIEFYHALPFSPELGSGLLSGRVDYARIARPGDRSARSRRPRACRAPTSTRASSRPPG